MKKYVLILVFQFLSLFVSGQIAYYDAINLDTLIDSQTNAFPPVSDSASWEAIFQIYSRYTGTEKKNSTLIALMRTNPFMKEFVPVGGAPAGLKNKATSLVNFNSLIKGGGSANVTNIVDGLAQFMVERAKEELNLAFFERFKERMDDPRYKDLQLLFPETYNTLSKINSEIYQLNNYIQALREAMHRDLEQIFEHANDVISQEKYKSYFEMEPQLYLAIRSGLTVTTAWKQGANPAEMILYLSKVDYGSDKISNNYEATLHFLNLISTSLLSNNPTNENPWVEPTDIYRNLISNKQVLKLYLGLIYQQNISEYDNITWEGNSTASLILALESMANQFDVKSADIELYLTQLAGAIGNVKTAIKNNQIKDENKFQDIFNTYDASLRLIEVIVQVNSLFGVKLISESDYQNFTRVLFIAKTSGKVVSNVQMKNYASAVVSLASALDTIFYLNQQNINTTLKVILTDSTRDSLMPVIDKYLINTSNQTLRDSIFNVSQRLHIDSNIVNQFFSMVHVREVNDVTKMMIKYGTFAANLVRADSPEEVKSVLEAAAMPVGSFRIKRQSNFSITVNGFVGASVGVQGGKEDNSTVVGAWAPVGPAFNKGINPKSKCASSFSIFVPIIDVGALALFRLDDDSTEISDEITWDDIFSPGLFLSYGFPKVPINLAVGYQLSPILKSVETGQPILSDQFGRIVATLSVDIPFFNIYNRSKNKKLEYSLDVTRQDKTKKSATYIYKME